MAQSWAHFLRAMLTPNTLHPLKHLVWSRVGHALGFVCPTWAGIDAVTEVALQKNAFDQMWQLTLLEMVDHIGNERSSGPPRLEPLASKLNTLNCLHASELRSFPQTYALEFQGVIDVFAGTAFDILREMIAEATGMAPELNSTERSILEQQLRTVLAAAGKRDTVKNSLRTLHISACLHASVRWDKKQQLTANDFYDFRHAAAALGYCDAFFTERPLRAKITANHTALDTRYGCWVIADVGDAVEYLQQIEGSVCLPAGAPRLDQNSELNKITT